VTYWLLLQQMYKNRALVGLVMAKGWVGWMCWGVVDIRTALDCSAVLNTCRAVVASMLCLCCILSKALLPLCRNRRRYAAVANETCLCSGLVC
jgi:hypothetical protein